MEIVYIFCIVAPVFVATVTIYRLRKLIKNCQERLSAFLGDVPTYKPSQLKSVQTGILIYSLKNCIKEMDKFWKIIAGMCVIIFACILAFVTWQSRDLMSTYFKQQQQKLELRSNQAVDSIIQENTQVKNAMLLIKTERDSLELVATEREYKIENLNSTIKSIQKTNTNLNNSVIHQNRMIEKLSNE